MLFFSQMFYDQLQWISIFDIHCRLVCNRLCCPCTTYPLTIFFITFSSTFNYIYKNNCYLIHFDALSQRRWLITRCFCICNIQYYFHCLLIFLQMFDCHRFRMTGRSFVDHTFEIREILDVTQHELLRYICWRYWFQWGFFFGCILTGTRYLIQQWIKYVHIYHTIRLLCVLYWRCRWWLLLTGWLRDWLLLLGYCHQFYQQQKFD